MKIRAALLGLAVVFIIFATSYDIQAVANARASHKKAAEFARRFMELDRQIRFQSGFEATSRNHGPNGREQGPAGQAVESKKTAALDSKQLIASDPALRARYLDLYRDGLDVQYGLLFRILGLSPDAEATLRDLLAERKTNELKAAEEAADQGLKMDDPEVKAMISQLDQPSWQDLRQMLGPAGIATLKQYWNDWPTVNLVKDLAGSLPTPTLTLNQAQQLVPALAAVSQKQANGTVIPDTINVEEAVAAAAPILDSEQLLTLTALLEKNEAKARISQLSAGQ